MKLLVLSLSCFCHLCHLLYLKWNSQPFVGNIKGQIMSSHLPIISKCVSHLYMRSFFIKIWSAVLFRSFPLLNARSIFLWHLKLTQQWLLENFSLLSSAKTFVALTLRRCTTYMYLRLLISFAFSDLKVTFVLPVTIHISRNKAVLKITRGYW